jgi:hypothetical protein
MQTRTAYLRLFWGGVILLAGTLVAGLVTHRSGGQLTYLLLGAGLIWWAFYAGMTGTSGFSYTRAHNQVDFETQELSWPKWLAVCGAAIAGIVLLLAALPGHAGHVAAHTSHTGLVVVAFAEAVWGWIWGLAFIGICVAGLRKKEHRGGYLVLLGLIAVVYLIFGLLYLLFPGEFGPVWAQTVSPFVDMWNLVHRA